MLTLSLSIVEKAKAYFGFLKNKDSELDNEIPELVYDPLNKNEPQLLLIT